MAAKKKGSWFITVLLVLNILAVLCLFAAYAAAFISPAKQWIFAFFGLAYPIFLILNLLFVLLWIITWKRYVFISLVSVLIGWNQLTSVYPFRFHGIKAEKKNALSVFSYNVHSLYGNERTESIPEMRSKVTEFLSGHRGDIVCIQEFFAIGQDYTKTISRFTKALDLSYCHYQNYRDFWDKTKINAIATFSRFPIVNQGQYRLEGKNYFAIFTDILIGDYDTIRVFNLHLESIRFGDEDMSFYSHLTEQSTGTTPLKLGSQKIMWKLRKAFIYRAKEVDILVREIRNSPYPVIVCGDFNDTPFSYTYRELVSGLQDSFREAGFGLFGETYAGKLPAFRIDYILYSDFFSAAGYRKFHIDLSDHYPIAAVLNMNN
jgi:endonuclease/exonuclease/phosphatase family metal-dependent hydrolase